MKNLRHSNIASVYEIIDDPNADKVYLVMQYIENGPIAHIQVRSDSDEVCEPIPPVELARAARQIFAGLQYLHRHGIVHRDLKPDNILMSRDKHVYLVDFGVAQAIDTTYRARIERKMAHSMAQSIAMSEAGEHACGPLVVGAKGTLLFIAP